VVKFSDSAPSSFRFEWFKPFNRCESVQNDLNDWNGLNVLNSHNFNGRTCADTSRRGRRLC
jgi:hypothetical protein